MDVADTAYQTLLARSASGHKPSKHMVLMLQGHGHLARDATFADESVMARYDWIRRKLLTWTAMRPDLTVLSLGSGFSFYPNQLPGYKGLWVDVDCPKICESRRILAMNYPNSVTIPTDINDIFAFEGNYKIPHGGSPMVYRVQPDLVIAEGLFMYLDRLVVSTLCTNGRVICDIAGNKRVPRVPWHLWQHDFDESPGLLFNENFKIRDKKLITEPERDQWVVEIEYARGQ